MRVSKYRMNKNKNALIINKSGVGFVFLGYGIILRRQQNCIINTNIKKICYELMFFY